MDGTLGIRTQGRKLMEGVDESNELRQMDGIVTGDIWCRNQSYH